MDNIKRHLSYILITAMTAAFVIESFSSAGGSFAYAGTGSGLPKVLKKPVRVLYVKNKKKKRIKANKMTYSYKKAYPASISTYNYSSKTRDTVKMKYTFRKNGKPKKSEMLTSGGQHLLYKTYRANGLLRRISYNAEGIAWKEIYQW